MTAQLAAACTDRSSKNLKSVSLRLLWYPQAQFAGYIVARELGFYRDAGLDVTLRPAGPDLKPAATVASGSDDFGIGVSNEIITARSNGVPLSIVAQVFQDSANRYVLKEQNRIANLAQLRGKKVGLWLGGDEAEFIAMLAGAGMKLSDVQAIPQAYSIQPFLRDDYVVSEVTTYNELLQLEDAGLAGKMQVISPSAYGCAIPGDMIFTTERMISTQPEVVKAIVQASIRGWLHAFAHPNQAIDLVLAQNKELKRGQQLRQLDEVRKLVISGGGMTRPGIMNPALYDGAQRVLMASGQLRKTVDSRTIFSLVGFPS
jgi:NitT/TauT family transport system substrate-binding protein